jgi:hypothetical protein
MYHPKPPGKASTLEKFLSRRGTCHDEAVNSRLNDILDTVQGEDLAKQKCSDMLYRYNRRCHAPCSDSAVGHKLHVCMLLPCNPLGCDALWCMPGVHSWHCLCACCGVACASSERSV